MHFPNWLRVHAEICEAIEHGKPVVALESTLISHGLPWPTNLETALASEQAIRDVGAVPAAIAVIDGVPTIGLDQEQLKFLATATGIRKASRRELAPAMALKHHAATTVAATMFLADKAGIRFFATGGIGGAHRDSDQDFDISADLIELSQTPVMVVCAGAKSILDLPKTLEILETLSVPVIGYRTDKLPAFYLTHVDLPVPCRVDHALTAARVFKTHLLLEGKGAILAQSPPPELAIDPIVFQNWCEIAFAEAQKAKISGAATTPFLLKKLAELSQGKTLGVNQALIVSNAKLAAEVAVAFNECG